MVKKIKYILLLTIIIALGMYTKSLARIKTNDPTVESGGTVTITISSQEPVASGAIKIKSNSGLNFKSASGGTVNGDLVVFSGTNNVTSGIATYTFTAPEVNENTTYKVEFSSQDMADENGNTVASSSATATVTVKGKNQGSSNNPSASEKATITKLVVGEKTYNNPKKDISLSVNNSVSSIKITPTISNGESYTINGEKSNTVKLETGTNKVTIKLASGDSYIVRISRLPKEEEVKPNQIQEPEDKKETPVQKLLLASLVIEGYDLTPEFSSEIYSYKIEKQIPSNIEELNVKGVANIEGATIEIVGNTELKDGENIISIVVKHEEETVAYQVVVIKEAKAVIPVSVGNVDSKELTRIPRWDTKQKILITTFTTIITLMGIWYGVIEYRYTKNKEENEFGEDLSLPVDDELKQMQVSPIFGEKPNDIDNNKNDINNFTNTEDTIKNEINNFNNNLDEYKNNIEKTAEDINNYKNNINNSTNSEDDVKNYAENYKKDLDNLSNNIDSFMNAKDDTKSKYDDFFGYYEKKPKTKSKGKHF